MAGNLPVTQGVELKIFWGPATSNEAINVIHLRNGSSAPIDQTLASTVSNSIGAAFTSSGLAAQVVPSILYKQCSLRDLAASTNPEFTASAGQAPGTATNTTPLPGNVSLCVSGTTGLRGASFRSRAYLWGFSVAAVATSGGISTTAQTAAASFLNTLRTNLAALPNPLVMVVLSRFTTPPGATSPIERNPPVMTNIVTWAVKDTRWDTQRRRSVPGI